MSFLLNILSKFGVNILLGLAIAIATGGWLKKCSDHKKEAWLHEETKEHYTAQMVKETNKFGQIVTSRNQAQIDLATFKSIMGIQFDSIIAAGKVKDKRLTSYTAITARLKIRNLELSLRPADTVIRLLPSGDTLYVEERKFEQGSRWYHIGGRVQNCERLIIDSLGVEAPLSIYGTYRRERGKLFGKRRSWFFRVGPKDYDIKVTSANPMVVIDSVVSFQLKKR